MPQSIQRRGGQQAVWKDVATFALVQVAGDDGGRLFITFCDQIMEILLGYRSPQTTMIYTKILEVERSVVSPLDQLPK